MIVYIKRSDFRSDITTGDWIVLKEGTVNYIGYVSQNVSASKVEINNLHDIDHLINI